MNPLNFSGDVPKGTITAVIAGLTALAPAVFGWYDNAPIEVQKVLAWSVPVALGIVAAVYIWSHVTVVRQNKQNEVAKTALENEKARIDAVTK